MKSNALYATISAILIILLSSCSTLEKASMHGFNNGYYKFKFQQENSQNVYVDVTDESIDVYHLERNKPEKSAFLTIPLKPSDSLMISPFVFEKRSLDIDLTAILLKYRPSVYGLPGQMTTDFNIALYAGWRHDNFIIMKKTDPLGKSYNKFINRGYDFGLFAGPGGTLISPFTTQNARTDEYNGLIIQTGIAGFIESNVASFGVALGLDYLLNPDREVWIYNNKPWVGFVVGIALN